MAPLVAEELVLLAYHPDGIVHGHGVELDCALAGALLLELADAGAVTLTEGRLRPVEVAGSGGHPALVETMDRITARPDRSPEWWIPRLSRGLRRRLLDGLVSDGVLTEQTHRWLGILTRHHFPESDDRPRLDALRRLVALLDDPAPPAIRTAALAGMVSAARLTAKVFGDADRRAVEQRLADVGDGEWAVAVRKAVQAVYAGTVSAAVAASTAPTTAGN